MRYSFHISLLFFLLSPLSLLAQIESVKPYPRWFGGIQYGRQEYQTFQPNTIEPWLTNQRRVQFLIGYQIAPQWDIQVGWGPARYDISDSAIGTNDAGQPLTEFGWGKDRSNTFSVLGRYTLKSNPLPHLKIELVAGATLLRQHNWGETIHTENGEVTLHHMSNVYASNWYVIAGPGVSYSFGRHFQATADVTFNKNLKGTLSQYNVMTTGNSSGISHSFSIGTRYRFLYK